MEKVENMTVVFRDFWESHRSDYFPDYSGDVSKSFLEDLGKKVIGDQGRKVVFTSVYKKETPISRLISKISSDKNRRLEKQYGQSLSSDPNRDDFNIWYTAENIRPPLENAFDAYFSYDLDTFSGLNYYIPLWLCRLGPTIDIANQNQIRLTNEREVDEIRQRNFAVISSNPEQIRMNFISRLSKCVEVSVFGRIGKPVTNKNITLQNFNFNICFENDLYPGYVTEKAFEAYMSGCIPVWRGIDAGEFFNKKAMIDVTNLNSVEAISKVIEVSKDLDLIQKMRKEPLLNKNILIKEIIAELQEKIHKK
jgi:hypothetical protein